MHQTLLLLLLNIIIIMALKVYWNRKGQQKYNSQHKAAYTNTIMLNKSTSGGNYRKPIVATMTNPSQWTNIDEQSTEPTMNNSSQWTNID